MVSCLALIGRSPTSYTRLPNYTATSYWRTLRTTLRWVEIGRKSLRTRHYIITQHSPWRHTLQLVNMQQSSDTNLYGVTDTLIPIPYPFHTSREAVMSDYTKMYGGITYSMTSPGARALLHSNQYQTRRRCSHGPAMIVERRPFYDETISYFPDEGSK